MSEDQPVHGPDEAANGPAALGEADFAKLRRLLLEPEQEQIRLILNRLDNPDEHAREVSEVLPDAIIYSAHQGDGLEKALAPTLERSTHRAIRRDRQAFADALFPVMGPAIRKSIAETLKAMIQGLNQALEHSLSWRGLKWRLESIRTGRSFGEVVLSKTLVFRVEQIFLIHRESGLLLQHVIVPEVHAQDADMVSGMLTAIQDFVRDSFQVDQEESLQTLEVGALQVWVEQGPHAVLAAAVRGNAPVELRHAIRAALEGIHQDLGEDLAGFDGDAAPFEAARRPLKSCLQSQTEILEQRTSPWMWVLLAVVVGLLGWWGVHSWQARRSVDSLVSALRHESGMVVTDVVPADGVLTVRGLRDPLARDPAELAAEHGFEAAEIRLVFEPYQALGEVFVLERCRRALDPPDGVTLELQDGTLVVAGMATRRWRDRARDVAVLVAGVTQIDDSGLVAGDDPSEAQRAMAVLSDRVEAGIVRFAVASSEISAEEAASLEPTMRAINELVRLAEQTFSVVVVSIEGHADPTGTPEVNVRLSRERAEAVVGLLVENGIPRSLIQPVGRGMLMPEVEAEEVDENAFRDLRKVTFAVEIRGGSEGGQGAP